MRKHDKSKLFTLNPFGEKCKKANMTTYGKSRNIFKNDCTTPRRIAKTIKPDARSVKDRNKIAYPTEGNKEHTKHPPRSLHCQKTRSINLAVVRKKDEHKSVACLDRLEKQPPVLGSPVGSASASCNGSTVKCNTSSSVAATDTTKATGKRLGGVCL